MENLKSPKPKNKGELVVSSGYSLNTATQQIPAVFEQKGVLDELKILGFDQETAKQVVGNILTDEEEESKDRLKAADMVFKVTGAYQDEKPKDTSGNTYNFIFSKEIQKDVREIEDKIKAKLIQNHAEEN